MQGSCRLHCIEDVYDKGLVFPESYIFFEEMTPVRVFVKVASEMFSFCEGKADAVLVSFVDVIVQRAHESDCHL